MPLSATDCGCLWLPSLRIFANHYQKWQVELAIFAENLEAEISVTDVQSGRADVYGSGQGFPRRIYMLFSGIHFDAVVVEGLRTVPTTATARVARADALVAALATEQRACGGYTDQATMVLMCATCGPTRSHRPDPTDQIPQTRSH